jgi:phospholipase C
VPVIVISPYSKKGYISRVQHEFGSILKFTEEAFDLGSLGSTDVRSDDFADCFQFAHKPRAFKKIPAPLGAAYFLHEPVGNEPPDDD